MLDILEDLTVCSHCRKLLRKVSKILSTTNQPILGIINETEKLVQTSGGLSLNTRKVRLQLMRTTRVVANGALAHKFALWKGMNTYICVVVSALKNKCRLVIIKCDRCNSYKCLINDMYYDIVMRKEHKWSIKERQHIDIFIGKHIQIEVSMFNMENSRMKCTIDSNNWCGGISLLKNETFGDMLSFSDRLNIDLILCFRVWMQLYHKEGLGDSC